MPIDPLGRQILRAAYDVPPCFGLKGWAGNWIDLDQWAESEGLDRDQVVLIANALCYKGMLIHSARDRNEHMLTANGLLLAERSGTWSEQELRSHRDSRFVILGYLADKFDRSPPPNAAAHWEDLLELNRSDGQLYRNFEVLLLEESVARADFPFMMGQVTPQGHKRIANWRTRVQCREQFSELTQNANIDRRNRGHEFEGIIERIAAAEDWDTEKNARAPGEEHDLVIHREREYYLVECKWIKAKAQPAHMASLVTKVGDRATANGIFFSVMGFTEQAKSHVADRLSHQLLLLFGPKDLSLLLAEECGFTDLLNQKIHTAVTKRQVEVDGDLVGR